MKRFTLTLISALFVVLLPGYAQENIDYSKIDILLIRGDYKKAIDTCRQILSVDTLNSEVYYKLGLAYQNLLPDDKSFDCFLRAAAISPDNAQYTFMVAKSYFNKGKINQAEPLLLKLCAIDSLNWQYAFYLTSVYMQKGRYDESIEIYNRFSLQDSSNYVFLDKIGFACLRKGELEKAIDLYNRSLALNNKNTNAIKNLSFLYSSTNNVDTALQLLTKAIAIDSTDMDLYARRAGIYYLVNFYSKALNDYLKILNSGDSAVLYLKRSGIGYSNTRKPKEAIRYLKLAYNKDSSDYETASYLGQNFYSLKDPKKSIYYYSKVLSILSPLSKQINVALIMLAESQKSGGFYKEAIDTYIDAMKTSSDVNLYMIVANLYDDKLNDIPKAIYYYDLFLDKMTSSKSNFKSDYAESIKKRLDFLKEKKNPAVNKN
ncbi:MAG: tetratricopeptide repeat protein [Bacteroidota bacterium]